MVQEDTELQLTTEGLDDAEQLEDVYGLAPSPPPSVKSDDDDPNTPSNDVGEDVGSRKNENENANANSAAEEQDSQDKEAQDDGNSLMVSIEC